MKNIKYQGVLRDFDLLRDKNFSKLRLNAQIDNNGWTVRFFPKESISGEELLVEVQFLVDTAPVKFEEPIEITWGPKTIATLIISKEL